jgi:hypothetical protein
MTAPTLERCSRLPLPGWRLVAVMRGDDAGHQVFFGGGGGGGGGGSNVNGPKV